MRPAILTPADGGAALPGVPAARSMPGAAVQASMNEGPVSSALRAPACPDCGAPDAASVGRLPDVPYFAGRRLAAPLAGGTLQRCRRCDLRFRHPLLGDERYAALYDNGSDDAWSVDALRSDQQRVLALVAQRLREARGPLALLDFGCYAGAFLAALPAGAERYGVEVNAAAAAQAVRRAAARVECSLDAFEPERRFDVIVAMDVVEHLPSPRALLARLLARLNPGGLLVLTTGDGGNWLARAAGARWWYWYFPEHIAFISRRWLDWHLPRLGARLLQAERFDYLTPDALGAARWRAFAKYLLRPAHHAAKRRRRWQQGEPDQGVPGIGLTADHLLVALTQSAPS